MSHKIVFRRKVRIIWLEQALNISANQGTWDFAKKILEPQIASENSGRETISKVLEHIRHICFEPPENAKSLLSDALRLYNTNTVPISIICWGMTIAVYPFIGSVASSLGRLFKLQGRVSRNDIQRRMCEKYGDRDYVNRITLYTISSFLDWGVVNSEGRSGFYFAGKKDIIHSPLLISWLFEAVMISQGREQMAVSEVLSHPVIFPIVVDKFNSQFILTNQRLSIVRENLNQDYVSIANIK